MAVTTPHALPITERSAFDLAGAIRTGELRAREVVEAHIDVLERAQPHVNAIAAERFDAARREADAADDRIAATAPDDDLPPLLGVPCTIKESIAVRGNPNCSGVVARRELRATYTAPAAQRLLDAGAVLLGVTNVSELAMWMESDNRVYGRTGSVYDPERIAGGSSGGEGAAVGCGGSPFGLASDMGGSTRLPAFFNGVFGHKATAGVVPVTGYFPRVAAPLARLVSHGPITRRAEDLMPILLLIAGPDGHDPIARGVALGDPRTVEIKGLSVLVSEHAWLRRVSRELREARDRAAAALADAGAKVQWLSLRSLRRAMELFLTAVAEWSGTSAREILVAEGAAPTVRTALRRGNPHTFATWLLLVSEAVFARVPSWRARRVLAAARAFGDELDATLGDAVLLHPPFATVAPRHGRTVGRPWALEFTAPFNLAGLPATQVPLGVNANGLPLGVQTVAGRDRDHVAIAVALELERVFGGWVPPARALASS